MKTIYTTIAMIFLANNLLFSQELNLQALLIPEELKINADAVLRLADQKITISAVDEMLVSKKRIVTVLNKRGNRHIRGYAHYNADTKIKKLSAIIYDGFGEKIKKYSKNDFKDVSAVSGGTLYSDSRVKYLEYTPTSYPYTVVFEFEYQNSSTGFIPRWLPLEGFNIAIQKSIYQLLNPLNIQFAKKEIGFEGYKVKRITDNHQLHYEVLSQNAIKAESLSIPFEEYTPFLIISMNEYALKGVKGQAKNWKEFGKWRYEYLKNGNDQLSESIISEIQDLVKGVENPINRAKKVYQYVQNKTRYISIQEDIGGWVPIPATEVHKSGYGDCKGLTNYTKALMDAANVKSYYSVVWAGRPKKNVFKDFPSMQGNHIILNIPEEDGNDIWLECTSQTLPFGYLGDFTDDRDLLVITPEGGIIKRTPSYKDSSFQNTRANVKLLKNGNLTTSLNIKSTGNQYNYAYDVESYTEKELEKHYKEYVWDYNNNLELVSTEFNNDKETVEFTEKIELSIENFATVSESNYLFKPNILNRNTNIPDRYRNRKMPLKLKFSFTDKDEYHIELPQEYQLSLLPETKEIKNKFGHYKASLERVDDKTIKYKREFSLTEGVFPKEDYKLYRKFIKSVARYDNQRIELTKQ
ncbi:protein of unknown function [Tenacibaculum sp. MAR_2009_124]|uniref:DUF3857 domain-containing protein n=1 Tax=Tenacibaculum sp. MAR_2009_124 TaxID=1250059 RepID=UPI0008948B66|nr:DUF3857 domain-containing protein [Tenacibaculum sp. MAR_2009_124]SEC30602.1 protein of unknown function [Tenacibaculum sp. MAR_2009_124]